MKLFRKSLIFFLFFFGIFFAVEKLDTLVDKQQKTRVESEGKDQRAQKPIKFAVFSDIHSDLEDLKKAVVLAKEEQSEFIVVTGDLTTVGSKAEFIEIKRVLDASGTKYYVIPGNHDYWYTHQTKQDYFQEIFGENYQSFELDGYKFILIDNGDIYEGVGEKQKVWIEQEIKECPKIYCLIFLHIPLNHPNSVHVMGEGQTEVASQAALLVKSFARSEIKEVFAGHLHYSSSYSLGGFRTNIVGAVTSERNFQSPKFMLVSLDDKVETREVFLTE